MDKVVKDGQVAVLISPGFGARWSTWAGEGKAEACLFHPDFVQAALDGVTDIEPIVDKIFGEDSYLYTGGWRDIVVVYLDEGTSFVVEEYDGSESLRTVEDLSYTA